MSRAKAPWRLSIRRWRARKSKRDTDKKTRMKNLWLNYGSAALLLLLAVHGSIAGQKPAPNEVTIDNFSYKPQTLTVSVGATVTWINRDDIPHTVLSMDKTTIASP